MSERINLNEWKEKAADTAGLLLEKALLLKDSAEEKARILAKKARLRAELARNGSEIKKLYTDLGSLYYCVKKDDPDVMMKQTCEEITALLEKNMACEEELKELEIMENPTAEPEDDNDITVEILELEETDKHTEAAINTDLQVAPEEAEDNTNP
ncbi:MAG: hypothetical protein MJ075_03375 [Oscillospiraceae bacterium]|nr:hypothetical protein [Oscillospiraceae bacterium]